ncbi:hypothetical protein [Anaerolentibacter hominis]|uniref:hypothetical protein n=1 Tax=Anaerolentibacter hominis TaxID=3079009 RepID=UPI0031B87F06
MRRKMTRGLAVFLACLILFSQTGVYALASEITECTCGVQGDEPHDISCPLYAEADVTGPVCTCKNTGGGGYTNLTVLFI